MQIVWRLLHLHEIVEMLYIHCSLSVCLSVCLCVSVCLWTKFQANGCTDWDVVFVKWLLNTLARTVLKLVTFDIQSIFFILILRWKQIWKLLDKVNAENVFYRNSLGGFPSYRRGSGTPADTSYIWTNKIYIWPTVRVLCCTL